MSASPRQIITIDKKTARRLLLTIQGLYPPRELSGKEGIIEFLEGVRSIQFDPINVVGRNPDLVLQSRVKDYQPWMLNELLYQDRILLDIWDKMASIGLMEDWPYFTRHRRWMEDRFGKPDEVVMQHAEVVLAQIKHKGPQSSLDFKHKKKTDWAWGPARVIRAALEGLYKMGQLGISHRINNRRYFDLIEKLLPEDLLIALDPNPTLISYQTWHVLRRISGMGLVHPNAGEQWGGILGVKSPERRKIISEAVRSGQLLEVSIEELPGEMFYLHLEQYQYLDLVAKKKSVSEAAFVAPLDNLLWDRKTVSRLFDFDYFWEVYKPKKKRKYGYYVLPVLYGDRMIARFDPEFDRKTNTLIIKNWWWEGDQNLDQKVLSRCLKDFLEYLGARQLKFSKELLKRGNLDWLASI
jgi:uncharacterized protein YcaQ